MPGDESHEDRSGAPEGSGAPNPTPEGPATTEQGKAGTPVGDLHQRPLTFDEIREWMAQALPDDGGVAPSLNLVHERVMTLLGLVSRSTSDLTTSTSTRDLLNALRKVIGEEAAFVGKADLGGVVIDTTGQTLRDEHALTFAERDALNAFIVDARKPGPVQPEPPDSLPKVGSVWIWEPSIPSSRETVTVTEVFHNGEEWWVRSRGNDNGVSALNTLDRWNEACVPAPKGWV